MTGESKSNNFLEKRERMVTEQLAGRDIRDPNVLAAMRNVARHEFVPSGYQKMAYEDTPLPIGKGQTISQPYIVALMSEKLEVKKGEKVLEIGTGSGYQAAVLAELGAKVYSIEIVEELGIRAQKTLKRLAYDVEVKIGDGYKGWPEHAPFDKIILTAAPPKIPKPLLKQLKMAGRLILPLDRGYQELIIVTKTKNGLVKEVIAAVMFVPMIGEVQKE